MTLTEYAKTHEELEGVGFIDHELPTAPKIIGLFGGFSLRDVQPLNSRNARLKQEIGPPPEELGLTSRDEIEAWYVEQNPLLAPYKRKILTRGFAEQGVKYLDVNWPLIVADYMGTLTRQEQGDLEKQYAYLGLNVTEYISFVNHEHRGGTFSGFTHIPSLQQRKEFVVDVINKLLLIPLFVDQKRTIDQKAVIILLPFGAYDFAQHCDQLIYVRDAEDVVAEFLSYLDDDTKSIIQQHEAACMQQPHTTVDISTMTDAQIINNIIYNAGI
jgi:hypothetical protein